MAVRQPKYSINFLTFQKISNDEFVELTHFVSNTHRLPSNCWLPVDSLSCITFACWAQTTDTFQPTCWDVSVGTVVEAVSTTIRRMVGRCVVHSNLFISDCRYFKHPFKKFRTLGTSTKHKAVGRSTSCILSTGWVSSLFAFLIFPPPAVQQRLDIQGPVA